MSAENPVIAVAYDVDGTMVDSEPLHVAAWYETLNEYGHEFTELPVEFQNSMAGRKPIEIAAFMVETLGIATTAEEFLAKKQARFLEKVRTGLRPMPGVVESIKRLGQTYKLCISTSLDREYVDLVLAGLGVAEDFSVIVTGDEITNGKPDPETYIVLAKKLGVDAREIAVLEDAKSGIISAMTAGCWCIAVENTLAAPQDVSGADKVVHSLDEVTRNVIDGLG